MHISDLLQSRLRPHLRANGARWRVALFLAGGASATVLATSSAHAGRQRHVSVDALAQRLTAWVSDGDVRAHDRAAQRVREGVPPAAFAAFLAAARAHPDVRYESILLGAVRYRKVSVRGQALAALASVGPLRAEQAIAVAADDHERAIRRLAWALNRLHPSPASHEIVGAMLARDPELAEELAAAYGPRLPEAGTDSDEDLDAEIVVFDDDPSAPPTESEQP